MSRAMPYKGYAFENRSRNAYWMEHGQVSKVSEVSYATTLAHAFYDGGWQDRGTEVAALNELIGQLRTMAIRVCEVRGRSHQTDRGPLHLAITELGDALADLGWEGWK